MPDSVEALSARARWAWAALIVALLVLRLPSLVEPAGGDQGLYAYAGGRMLAGAVMYRDMWDQKPPGIVLVYAGLERLWSGDAIVPALDLLSAAAVAGLLVLLGRRRYGLLAGYAAAAIFLALGDPYLQRLSGIYVRGQCEPVLAVAVTAGLAILAGREPARAGRYLATGVALAVAFWLKYNALAFALPLALAAWAWQSGKSSRLRPALAAWGWMAAGFLAVTVAVLLYFMANGALVELYRATISYNLHYSDETYRGPASALAYVVSLPFVRAGQDMLWFLGGLGLVLLAIRRRFSASTLVLPAWITAALISMAINGGRSLPNYFVQANPALALTAAAGLATAVEGGLALRSGAILAVLLALWRVGTDTPVMGLRLASVPGLIANVRYDLAYARGTLPRDEYLSRFSGQKHNVLEIDRLARFVRDHTAPADPIFVFGFSGGSVCWKADRVSSSRFFWSMPIISEFDATQPTYGPAGLLEDLNARPPAIVALQKEEWHSRSFFLEQPALRDWLARGYVLDHETDMFSVYRRATR